jgi:FO synthase
MHAYSPMEVAHMCDVSGLSPRAVFARLREAGLDSTPGTAAEVLHDGVRERISPNKLPVARWVEIIEASHLEGLRSTVTVMFGHIEEPAELAEHMRVVRALPGAHRAASPSSCRSRSSRSTRCSGAPTGSRRSRARRTSSTPPRSGSRSADVPSLPGELGEDGLDAATEALRWGVNDLGGTLMEESISRMAGSYHGPSAWSPPTSSAPPTRRPPRRRSAPRLYEIRARYELEVAA